MAEQRARNLQVIANGWQEFHSITFLEWLLARIILNHLLALPQKMGSFVLYKSAVYE